MNKLVVLNHKMNLEYDDVFSYIDDINHIDTDYSLIVCPSFIYLNDFINHCSWGIGAQNVNSHESGDYTGEISALQLKSLGLEYSMIGHYERKKYFHETDAMIRDKLIACLESNISPILCFGETGKWDDIVHSLDILLDGIENIDFIIFAYEPLMVKSNEDVISIEKQVNDIYDYLFEKYHSKPNIIYGGGISSKDFRRVMNIEHLNGILIGKISVSSAKIKKIIGMEK